MATHGGPTLIETPQAPPPPYGIFDVSMGPMAFPEPAAVGGGVFYVPDTCEEDIFLYAMNCPPVSGLKTFSTNEAAISGAPFAVITSYTCGSIGYSFEEVERKVRLRMALREQRGVEKRIWQGDAGLPGLFNSAVTLSAAGCVTEAVEVLEQQLADAGVIGGIIHARPGMCSHFSQAHLLERQGRQLKTMCGTPINFGQGYNGQGPAGQAPTTSVEYVYATGRVLIWADEVVVPPLQETFNKSTNQQFALAERVFAVAIECGIWAVEVTRTCATTGV